jgi:glycosyltransferase involved in cell wall biosynthesis
MAFEKDVRVRGIGGSKEGPIGQTSIGQSSIRLAILGPAPPDRGGIAHETARVAAELSRLTSVRYFTFSRAYPRWLDPRRFSRDPRLAPAPAVPVLDYLSPRTWTSTAVKIAEERAGSLIVPWWTSFWALPVRTIFRSLERSSPGTRRVLLCHNLADHERGAFRRFLTVGAFSAADAFLVHAEENRRELAKRFPRRTVACLPLPAPDAAADREAARKRLGVDGPLALFVGLVRRYKGVETLLAAAPRIVRESGARIAVVGEVFPDASFLTRLHRASPMADRILWKDQYVSEEEMGMWLAASDVVVLPYREVSGSAIAARAIGARRPMAASAVGGLKDIVVPGVTGELFPPGDAGGLADAVSRVLTRGPGAYAPGLERAARENSWPRYAERILDFIRSLSPGIVANG